MQPHPRLVAFVVNLGVSLAITAVVASEHPASCHKHRLTGRET